MTREGLPSEKPVLLFGSNYEDDHRAYMAMLGSGIPCRYVGSSKLDRSPVLVWHYREYFGPEKIIEFIRRHKEG